jgi:EAL domain-containing protein (putative c-di-GMP-specific phosphodiesterase class I)
VATAGAAARSKSPDAAAQQRMLAQILERHRVRAVYQPIIDLATGEVAAYESLARGPAGSPLESPGMLFDTARRSGRLPELEWACRAAALSGALDADLGTQISLFINVEPSVVGGVIPAHVETLFRIAERKLRLVMELTERDLTRRPADLLRLVAWARERYWGVALDDVGAEPESLALLPFVEPDVVKLDMRLVQEKMTAEDEGVVSAVRDYCRRTGATVLAEGIETEEHLQVAKAHGAMLGQGWYFGRPGPLDHDSATRAAVKLLPPPVRAEGNSAFEILEREYEVETMSRERLLELTDRIERLAMEHDPAPVVLACFGHADRFHPRNDIYAALADRCTLVGVLGVGMDPDPSFRVRCTPIPERDPLAQEWVVAVVGHGVSEVVAARSLGTDRGGLNGTVEVIETSDRQEVLDVAHLLMNRVVPARKR